MVEQFSVKFGDPSCRGFWDITQKADRETDKQSDRQTDKRR